MTERMVDSGTSKNDGGEPEGPLPTPATPVAEPRAAAQPAPAAPRTEPAAAPRREPQPAPAVDASFEARASRFTAALPGALRRIPFTASVVVVTLVVGARRPHGVDPDLAGGVVPAGRLRPAGAARGEDLDAADGLVLLPDPRPVPQRPDHVRRHRGRLRDAAGHPRRRDRRRRRRDRRDPAGVAAGLGALGHLVAVGGRPDAGARRRLHHRSAHRPRRHDRRTALAVAAAGAGGAVVLRHRRVPVRGHALRCGPRDRGRDRGPRRAAAVRCGTGIRATDSSRDPHARLRRSDRARPDRARGAALPRARPVRLRGRAGRSDGRTSSSTS